MDWLSVIGLKISISVISIGIEMKKYFNQYPIFMYIKTFNVSCFYHLLHSYIKVYANKYVLVLRLHYVVKQAPHIGLAINISFCEENTYWILETLKNSDRYTSKVEPTILRQWCCKEIMGRTTSQHL